MHTEPAELLALADDLVSAIVPKLVAAHDQRDNGGPEISFRSKSNDNDIVTEMDEWCERTLVDGLLTARPNDGIVGEEGAAVAGTSGVRWVIDPIDGTTNYLYNLSGYSVSVAAQIDGQTVAAIVADPVRHETYRAVLGDGANLNGATITTSGKASLATTLVGTGFNYEAELRRQQAIALVELLPKVRDIRRIGGAALDICRVASGRLDAYYEAGLSVWDVAAATLIATEAGATYTDIGGRTDRPGTTAVSSAAIHDEFLNLLHSCGAAWERPAESR
ncbi:MAG: inositol monophosphatase family protein [Acidimicrobiales bacterium]